MYWHFSSTCGSRSKNRRYSKWMKCFWWLCNDVITLSVFSVSVSWYLLIECISCHSIYISHKNVRNVSKYHGTSYYRLHIERKQIQSWSSLLLSSFLSFFLSVFLSVCPSFFLSFLPFSFFLPFLPLHFFITLFIDTLSHFIAPSHFYCVLAIKTRWFNLKLMLIV